MSAKERRGSGFVHLNTPAAIVYTAGQTLSLSDVRRKRRRVECVQLPRSVAVWRRAFVRYAREDGYSALANDVDDERAGSGVLAPPLAPTPPPPPRASTSVTAADVTFFVAAAAASDGARSSSNTHCPTTTRQATPSSASVAAAVDADTAAQQPVGGIAVVTHHKVAGAYTFTYPDYDGVLSAGVVPQVVQTAEEAAEAAAARVHYIALPKMTDEERSAFEELQTLWKSRSRSHSAAGAAHRAVVGVDGLVPGRDAQAAEVAAAGGALAATGDWRASTHAQRGVADKGRTARVDETVDESLQHETTDQLLEEALRMADDLLRYA